MRLDMPHDADLAARLAVIVEFAPKLRGAGVESVNVDGISFRLLPPPPVSPPDLLDSGEELPKTLLEDPESYGLPEGSEVPGFRRPDDLRKA